jgi:hypothetical protein
MNKPSFILYPHPTLFYTFLPAKDLTEPMQP